MKVSIWVAAGTVLAASASLCQVDQAMAKQPQVYRTSLDEAHVKVIDGDTFDLDGYGRFRLHGADAPEDGQICIRDDGTILDASNEAKAALEFILSKGEFTAIKTSDSYGRIVAYIEVDDKDVAAALIEKGLAVLDARYTSGTYERNLEFVKQGDAKAERLGVHACMDFELPSAYRERMKKK